MILHRFKPEGLKSDTPWYCFAQDRNLNDWREHFMDKEIPHAICRHKTEKRMWIRYEYDRQAGVEAPTTRPRKSEDVPQVLVKEFGP